MLSLILLAALLSMANASKHGAWGYNAPKDPKTWSGTCASGFRQSPIDIRFADVDYAVLKRLHFINYIKSGPVKVQNNGHTVMISGFGDWGDSQPFIFGGALEGKYKLLQIHFHWGSVDSEGSEHTLGTLHYPVEAHFVHQKEGTENSTSLPGDGLAVVGVFLSLKHQDANTPFLSLETALKQVVQPDTSVKMDQYSPSKMLPNNRDNFYTYEGSLTTPGCDETVIWTILAESSPVTKDQLALLRNIKSSEGQSHKYNYRPIQPLNGRRIKYRSALMDHSEIYQAFKSSANSYSRGMWRLISSIPIIAIPTLRF